MRRPRLLDERAAASFNAAHVHYAHEYVRLKCTDKFVHHCPFLSPLAPPFAVSLSFSSFTAIVIPLFIRFGMSFLTFCARSAGAGSLNSERRQTSRQQRQPDQSKQSETDDYMRGERVVLAQVCDIMFAFALCNFRLRQPVCTPHCASQHSGRAKKKKTIRNNVNK